MMDFVLYVTTMFLIVGVVLLPYPGELVPAGFALILQGLFVLRLLGVLK